MVSAWPVLLVIASVLLSQSDTQGVWCNKPYPPQNEPAPAAIQPNTTNPYPLPSTPFRNFSAMPNLQPYTTETTAFLYVTLMGANLAEASFTAATTTGLQVVAPVSVTAGGRVSIPFNITALPQTSGSPATVLCAISSTTTGRLIEQQVVYIYRLLPNPYGGSTTKVDNSVFRFIAQNITTGEYAPFFPYGFYYDSTWLTTNSSHLDLVKAQGVTSLQPVYPYNEDLLEREMTYAYSLGLRFVLDLKSFTGNDTAISQAVIRFRSHPGLYAYYLADEPDGWGIPVSDVLASHLLVKSLDAYHPTMLVLNCYYMFPQWIDAADIIMADPYPVGINATPCNITYGCCGCDDCFGLVTDVPQRAVSYYAQVGSYTKALWLVLQAFGAQAHWSRWPDPAEERYMTYAALIKGAIGISYWDYPTGLLPPSNSSMSMELVAIGNELLYLSSLFLPATSLPVTTSSLVIARAWRVNDTAALLIVANSNTISTEIVIKFTTAISGVATVLYESNVTPRTLSNGVLEDSIGGYAVRIYSIFIDQHNLGFVGAEY